ncbi:sodium:solute symporter family transporter [Portibacter lacus]|nr:sodium/solute symporter [Portibacter lacus]
MESTISINYSDYFIILLFFVFVGTIGYSVSSRNPNPEQLYFAGRSLNWPIIGFSILASNISTLTMLGLTADAYLYGVSSSSYEWVASLVLIVLAVFIAPIYLKNKINTVPEYFNKRYGRIVQKYFSIVSLIISSTVHIAGPLFAGAVLINLFIPEVSVWQASVAVAIFSSAYTAFGGMSAVVYTDFFQAILFLMISIIICFALFAQHDFSFISVIKSTPTDHFKMVNPIDNGYLPWLGLVTGLPILGFYYWCTDQVIVQRIISARNLKQAQYGIFFGAFLKLSILFVIILPGIMAIHVFPEVSKSQDLYAIIIKELIPNGVIGLILAGLLAAMISSIDSSINSSATLIVYDFIKPKFPKLSNRRLVFIGRITVCLIMFISLAWTPIIDHSNGIWAYAQTVLTYLTPPLVCILFFGIFSSRGNQKVALFTLIGGHLSSLILFILQFYEIISIHFTILAGFIFLISIILYQVGLLTQTSDTNHDKQLNFKFAIYRPSKFIIKLAIAVIISTLLSILPFLIKQF